MSDAAERLAAALARHDELIVAVSGGVDSLTLAAFAGRRMKITAAHAVSPAVPPDATARVRAMASAEGWTLRILNAREFSDPAYLKNPLNRCYFCKTNLYARIAEAMDGTIASGANIDDLGEYRPGLTAAAEHGVVHPYVEAGISKAELRALAASLGLGDVATLPAQPCLASRIETGIAIDAADLRFIEEMETLAAGAERVADIRCRITAEGVKLESSAPVADDALAAIRARCRAEDRPFAGLFPYRRGSAFLTDAGA